MHTTSWMVWAAILFLQNISFTYVSRARSSGSLLRHFKASIFSNGIWIFSQIIMLGPMLEYLLGKHGHLLQIESASVYTFSTVAGSIFAHWLAMKTEKGKNAVGASKLYAQVPVAEWAEVQSLLSGFREGGTLAGAVARVATLDKELVRIKQLAEEAHVCAVGALPVSGVQANKVAGELVVSGLDPDPAKYMTQKS